MHTTNFIGAPSAAAFDRVPSSGWERLTSRRNTESLCEVVLVTVTGALLSFLSYTFSQALQNYQVF